MQTYVLIGGKTMKTTVQHRTVPVQVKTIVDETGVKKPLAIYWDDEPYPVEILFSRELDTIRNRTGDGLYYRVQAGGQAVGLIYNRTADSWLLEIQAA
jgi:hypothetical protein